MRQLRNQKERVTLSFARFMMPGVGGSPDRMHDVIHQCAAITEAQQGQNSSVQLRIIPLTPVSYTVTC